VVGEGGGRGGDGLIELSDVRLTLLGGPGGALAVREDLEGEVVLLPGGAPRGGGLRERLLRLLPLGLEPLEGARALLPARSGAGRAAIGRVGVEGSEADGEILTAAAGGAERLGGGLERR
jgi:hypothetical protein